MMKRWVGLLAERLVEGIFGMTPHSDSTRAPGLKGVTVGAAILQL